MNYLKKNPFLLGIVFTLFSMSQLFAQGTIDIDYQTKRFVGKESNFNRTKYLTVHAMFINKDDAFEAFKKNYNLQSSYKGSRRVWSPLNKIKNGVIPSKVKKTFSGDRNVNALTVSTGFEKVIFHEKDGDYSKIDVEFKQLSL